MIASAQAAIYPLRQARLTPAITAVSRALLLEDLRSTGYGVLATANGLGDFASSLAVGLLWTAVGPAAGFTYAAGLSVIGAAIVFRVR